MVSSTFPSMLRLLRRRCRRFSRQPDPTLTSASTAAIARTGSSAISRWPSAIVSLLGTRAGRVGRPSEAALGLAAYFRYFQQLLSKFRDYERNHDGSHAFALDTP